MNNIVYSEMFVAGEKALASLKDAREFLIHARNWGVVDMLGGGLLSGYMKYSDIKEYEKRIKKAELEMRMFGDMLGCVNMPSKSDSKFDSFLKIVDLLRDNIWIDSMMQFRIKDAIVKLDETIDIVESALGELLQEDVTDHFGKT